LEDRPDLTDVIAILLAADHDDVVRSPSVASIPSDSSEDAPPDLLEYDGPLSSGASDSSEDESPVFYVPSEGVVCRRY
jgi:hypothetical protein